MSNYVLRYDPKSAYLDTILKESNPDSFHFGLRFPSLSLKKNLPAGCIIFTDVLLVVYSITRATGSFD